MGDQTTNVMRDGPPLWLFIVAACGVVILVALVGYSIIDWTQGVDLGDAYEGLSALFSGLAFIGVIYALAYQRAELKFQREELALTREEMVNQRHEMEAQNATLAHQRFENSFFQLLKFQRDSMQAMRVVIEHGDEWEGSMGFRVAVSNLERSFGDGYGRPMEEDQLLKYVDHNFKQFCASDGSDFGHYFRTLFHLIEFVDGSIIEGKPYYVGLVRAQLSTDELSLLFFNGLSEEGKQFKHFIEKYALLKNWRKPKTFQETYGLYPPKAYGE
jgi:hypothetical protein